VTAHPGSGYHWDERDIDGDEVPEGLVVDEGGNLAGINGYRLKKPTWTKNTQWMNPQTGQIENMYEKRYNSRKTYNEANGIDTLKTTRAKLGVNVKEFMDATWRPGSKAIERKVPRSAIVAFLIASPVGGDGAALDRQFLATYGPQFERSGISPAAALAQWHKDPNFRQRINDNLTQAFAQRGGQINGAIRAFAGDYVARMPRA
jgi:hypothetical protein